MVETYEQSLANRFIKMLDENIAHNTSIVVSGGAEDYVKYREHVGKIREVELIKSQFIELVKSFDPY